MSNQPSPEKQLVKDYYDLQGWKKERGSLFTDAARFEDMRPVVNDYRIKCHLRVNRHLIKGGKFLLDIASGPVQYPEYLSYSDGYQYRICGDISFTALQEAKKILGDSGFCVQCDVTRLPFAKETLDGIVSLHTIYHVPANEQKKALSELFRALAPGRNAVVVYSFARYSILLKVLQFPFHTYQKSRQLLGNLLRALKIKPPLPETASEKKHGKLYFFPHNFKWFQQEIKPLMDFELYSWRSVTVKFTRFNIRPRLGGKFWLNLLYRLEDRFPRWFGKHGAYPMLVFKKPANTAD